VSSSSQANETVAAIAPVRAAYWSTPAQIEAKPHSDTAPVQSLPFRGDCNWSGAAGRWNISALAKNFSRRTSSNLQTQN